jgi:hypothetical protein
MNPWRSLLLSIGTLAACALAATGCAQQTIAQTMDGSSLRADAMARPPVDRPTPIEDVEPLARCAQTEVTEVFAPTLLFADQPLTVTARARGGSDCNCSVQLRRTVSNQTQLFALERCNCCDGCDCIDRGYEGSFVSAPLGAGEYQLLFPPQAQSRSVVVQNNDQACRDALVGTIEILRPDLQLRQGGPQIYWARVRGSHRRCCFSQVGFVVTRAASDFTLRARSCDVGICEVCMGNMDEPFRSDFALGELSPGVYRVRANNVVAEFTVAP